ncbi:putative Proteasome regulatory ATPase subunittcc1l83 [Leptomonas seymouri]|uniref:Putative Proteasome regulatory ATPase subunittcc1l83 n=1 Tax=Leptomonas seymouri TaxID=5684 RepID=A0A0N1IGY9_LEPSE|nr:putative Proteasome regulatory ATPase subunittcc1l83 [Leptomonas seymouri]|eukprot:KPI83353.1 putative Proteasome regulatory ATPase subunittcc1l83 [Leptomonas seymouri]
MATPSVAAAAATRPHVLAQKKQPKESQNGKPAISTSLYEEYERLSKDIQNIQLKTMICKTETHQLMKEESAAKQEVKRIQAVPLVLGNFVEAVDSVRGIVSGTSGSQYFVRILSTLNKEHLKPNGSVGLHKSSNACVQLLPSETDATITLLNSSDRPDVTYSDVGGLDMQKQEIREAVELPLTHAGLYEQIGIDPPRGVLLYGPPGTGKTMLVKAVAQHTKASFIRVVGSEFVQKFLGEGPRKVRDVFRLARENAPSIIFIDEVDSIATKRFDAQTGADREVQRVLVELLTQMDGFDQTTNVKVIMATNRWDTLDPALLRPGRLDRKIEFPYPDRRQKRLVFQVCTSKMNLSPEVDLEDYVTRPEKLSGADIQSICQEAGMLAVRKNRYVILPRDIENAYRTIIKKTGDETYDFYS